MSLARIISSYRPRKSVCLQIMSDLHLEVGQQYAKFSITPRANHLVLAGDIGRLADYEALRDFLSSQCAQFTHVYFVLGNHEFFGVSRQEGLRLAERLQQEPMLEKKLSIMNQKRVDVQDVTILGCTLQSYVPPEAEETVRTKINDFRRIVDWTVADHVAEHARDVNWLKDEITSIRTKEATSKRRIVVITHHAPSTKGTSKPSDESNPWSSAFATDLLEGPEKSCLNDVQWWISGHTHHSAELVRGTVKLVSNQRGYVLPTESQPAARETAMSKKRKLWHISRQHQETFDPSKAIAI